MVDVRLATCLIVRKNGEYLVGKKLYGEDLQWSNSPYDAWKTRNRDEAQYVAKKAGGILMLFNPVLGQLRVY